MYICMNCIYLAPYGEDLQCLLPNPVNNMFIYIIKYVIILFFKVYKILTCEEIICTLLQN